MLIWANVVLNGLLMGSFYALVALGLGLIFGVMDIVNFAHGALLTLAMFIVYGLIVATHIDPYLAIVPTAVIMFGVGIVFQRWFVSPVLKRERDTSHLTIILLTSGIWWALQNGILFLVGADFRTLDTAYSNRTLFLGDIPVALPRAVGFAAALVIVFGLEWFLRTSDLGRALRATSQDREAARLMGIKDFKVYEVAFGIGTALVGITACLLVPFYYVQPNVGDIFVIFAFIIVVLGGLGSIVGTFLAGLLVGLIEAVGSQLFSLEIARVLVFAVFVAVLIWRPSGLLGRRL